MRLTLYKFLVNKHLGISQRYHKVHDNARPIGRVLSWIYLLWLNFAYYCLFCRFLGKGLAADIYEKRRLNTNLVESRKNESSGEVASKLLKYDVISFDIFDTLIYRPFSAPTDLFYLIGQELEFMDFARIRGEIEGSVRWEKYEKEESFEVTLEEIWTAIEKRTGIPAHKGMEVEIRLERELCYANPYMMEVYKLVRNQGKEIVYTSDMYLPSEVLYEILEKNGYDRHQMFLSCELNKNKGSGELFEHVKEQLGRDKSFIHIGDNDHADVMRARKAHFATHPVMNPNKKSVLFRAHDLSPIIGGAYRGIVNNRIYCGLNEYSRYYEYGYIYGGLFVLGFCHFIHEYCKKNQINKILFLARDGEIIKRVFSLLYGEEKIEYVYISRLAASKISAGYDKYDFIKKMVYHKVNQKKSIAKILKAAELSGLEEYLEGNRKLRLSDELTSNNVKEFVKLIDKHWDRVLEIYKPQREAAGRYFSQYISDGDRVAAIDIGWAGTGAMALRSLVKNEWGIDATVTGIVAGTNTPNNVEPFMSESFLLSGELVSYLYSSMDNRELWKKHSPSLGYNLFFELLTSSESPSLKGYYPDKSGDGFKLEFLKKEENGEGIREIQAGILDFARDYIEHFGRYQYMLNISGRDAYAPMIVAASYNEKYLNKLYEDFNLKVEVGS